MKTIVDTYTMNNGVTIPCVGFGTWQTPNDQVGYDAVKKALEVGYRHIDTAAVYGNEESIGQAMVDSGLPREAIFLTTKLWNDGHGYEATMEAFETSLKKLQTAYVDLYLIHWPNPLKFRDHWEEANAGSWKAMEELLEAGKIKAIGISNFRIHHIEALLKTAKVVPAVNQIRLCPGDAPDDLINYCRDKGILLEGYSPLGTGKIFGVSEIKSIAEKHERTVADVALKWSIQRGFLPLPKSVTPKWIESNASFFDFELTEEDMMTINALDGVCGKATDPDTTKW